MHTFNHPPSNGDRSSGRRLSIRLAAVTAALALLVAACGSDDDDTAADTSTSETSPDDSSTSSSSTTIETTTTSDASTTESSDDSSTTTTLAGKPWEGFFQADQVMAVVGVAHDDVLNVRSGPGASEAVVTTAAPHADDLVASGEARELPSSFWYELTVDGETGWASARFLALIGPTDDATAEFLDGGDLPETETMVEMGELVAAGFASTDPQSLIVQSAPASVGDLGEITYDVIGIGDDAVFGYRLHVFAAPTESGEGFVLKSIERTTLCGRGLSGELCT